MEILSSGFSDHNGIQVEANYKGELENSQICEDEART